MVRCGNCKQHHDNANAVRACYSNTRTQGVMPSTPPIAQRTLEDTRREATQRDARSGSGLNWSQLRQVAQASTPRPIVPEGHYALQVAVGLVKFYRVEVGTHGKWKGFTFLSAQASDEYYPIKHPQTKQQVLAAIAVNPREAMERYGQELGLCGRCGRTLTDKLSRALGIGPICRDKI